MQALRIAIIRGQALTRVRRFVALVVTTLCSLLLIGCGGGGTTTTTTTGAAPTFTSTPPTISEQGIIYTYQITSTTTDNSTVTYALTTGPSGAVITGNTLTWTPTYAESRTSNAFTITATTSNKGTATQSFSLTPTGDILGTVIDHAVTSAGVVDSSEDLSGATIQVLLPDSKGGYTTLNGSGNSSGSFTVTNVPPGSFWLHVPRIVNGQVSDNYIWTNANNVDLGALIVGRPGATPEVAGVTVNASVTLGVTPGSNDTMGWISPDADASGNPPPPAGTAYSASFSQSGNLIDGSKGDHAYLIHYKGLSASIDAIVEDIAYTSITETDGTTQNLTGTMTPINGASIEPVIKITQFDPLYSGLTNTSTVVKQFFLGDSGYSGSEGPLLPVMLVSANLSAITADTDLGSITYGTVTPSGSPSYEFFDSGFRSYTVGSNTLQFPVGSTVLSTGAPTSSNVIVPLLSLPTSPLVNGSSFFADQTLTSSATQIAWSIPVTGTATFYELQITDASDAFVTQPQSWFFYTPNNSVTVPNGILQSGKSYVFTLMAVDDSGTTFATAPFRTGSEIAYAYESSGLMTVGSSTGAKAAAQPNGSTYRGVIGPDGKLHFQRL